MWWASLVEIGLTDLPNSRNGATAPPPRPGSNSTARTDGSVSGYTHGRRKMVCIMCVMNVGSRKNGSHLEGYGVLELCSQIWPTLAANFLALWIWEVLCKGELFRMTHICNTLALFPLYHTMVPQPLSCNCSVWDLVGAPCFAMEQGYSSHEWAWEILVFNKKN